MELYVTLFLAAVVVRAGWLVAGAILEPLVAYVREWWDELEPWARSLMGSAVLVAGAFCGLFLLGFWLGTGGR